MSEYIYQLIMSYPFPGIPRSEKYRLVEWLRNQIPQPLPVVKDRESKDSSNLGATPRGETNISDPYDPDLKCPKCGATGLNAKEWEPQVIGDHEQGGSYLIICECGHIIKDLEDTDD